MLKIYLIGLKYLMWQTAADEKFSSAAVFAFCPIEEGKSNCFPRRFDGKGQGSLLQEKKAIKKRANIVRLTNFHCFCNSFYIKVITYASFVIFYILFFKFALAIFACKDISG